MIEADLALVLTCRALGFWGVITSLQWWADRRAWREGGAFGWDLLCLSRSRLFGSRVLAGLFAALPLPVLIFGQFAASAFLLATPVSGVTAIHLALLMATTALLCLRSHTDGADKMAMAVIPGAFLQLSAQSVLVQAGACWIAGQLTIAYVTSGAAKVRLPEWRNGSALVRAMSSYGSGHRIAAAVIGRKGAAFTFAWGLMLVEILFPVAMLAGPAVLVAVLAAFFLFHLATAAFMGLNTYPWAFLAAYPSAILVAGRLHEWAWPILSS